MRIILNGVVDNSDLPYLDPLVAMLNDDVMGLYGMLDKTDASGKAGPLVTSTTFNSLGAVCTNDATGVITTPVYEADAMTIVAVWNLKEVSGQICNAIANLSPSAAPYTGLRVATSAAGQDLFQVATGGTTTAVKSINASYTDSWVARAFTVSSSKIAQWSPDGTSVTTTGTTRNKSALPFYINGYPTSVDVPNHGGFTGQIALLGFYNKEYDQATITALLAKAVSIAQRRGITL